MNKINRRSFLKKTYLRAGSAFILSQLPKELFAGAEANDMPVGFQS